LLFICGKEYFFLILQLFGTVLIFTGVLDSLLPYETERQRHVISIIGAINGLNTLFSTEAFPIVFARTMGLTMTDSMHNIKVVIITVLLGYKY